MDLTSGVLILAGGKSERMAFPKPYLIYKGKTFLEKIIEGYHSAGMGNICLVINKEHCQGEWKQYFDKCKPLVSLIEKTDSTYGRFHSIKLGLKNFINVDFCFIHNVDNPFLDKETTASLLAVKNLSGYTVAHHKGKKGHPLLISKSIVKRINEDQTGVDNLRDILLEFPRQVVEVNNREILLNVNTPDDYEHYILRKELLEGFL